MILAEPVSGQFFAGNDHEWEFTVVDDDGVAINVTGMTPRFVMARTRTDTPVITTEGVSPTATASLSEPLDGKFVITVASADTEGLVGTYYWQAQIEDVAGKKSNVLHGYFTFDENMVA